MAYRLIPRRSELSIPIQASVFRTIFARRLSMSMDLTCSHFDVHVIVELSCSSLCTDQESNLLYSHSLPQPLGRGSLLYAASFPSSFLFIRRPSPAVPMAASLHRLYLPLLPTSLSRLSIPRHPAQKCEQQPTTRNRCSQGDAAYMRS